MATNIDTVQSQCPAFKDGKCPFATQEVKDLLHKLKVLPDFSNGCPHQNKEALGSMNKEKFDAVVKDLLGTPEGQNKKEDLAALQKIVDETFDKCEKLKFSQCPHFAGQAAK